MNLRLDKIVGEEPIKPAHPNAIPNTLPPHEAVAIIQDAPRIVAYAVVNFGVKFPTENAMPPAVRKHVDELTKKGI